jgi:hypothetical protein
MPLLTASAPPLLRRDHPNVCLIALTGDEAPALPPCATPARTRCSSNELVEALVD